MPRLALLAVLLAVAPLMAQQRPDLSGSWVLQGGPDSTATPDAGASPSGSRQGRAAAPRDRDLRQFGLLMGMAGAVSAFTIDQADTAITVTNADGFSYVLRPGGGDQELTILDTLTVKYKARWDGSFLAVEWQPEGGGKYIERYQLSDSGLYLRVDTQVQYQRFRQGESRLYRLETGS